MRILLELHYCIYNSLVLPSGNAHGTPAITKGHRVSCAQALLMTFLRFLHAFIISSLTTIGMDLLNELKTHNGHSIDGETFVVIAAPAVFDWLRFYRGYYICRV